MQTSATSPVSSDNNILCNNLLDNRFQLPAFEDPDESVQISLVKEAAARHGIRAKLRGDEIYQEGLSQPPKFLLNMEHYPKVSFSLN